MITYNEIYEAARKERYSEQLQKLSKSFIKDVAEYIKEKKEIASKENESFSDIILKTRNNLRMLLLYLRNLLPEEERRF